MGKMHSKLRSCGEFLDWENVKTRCSLMDLDAQLNDDAVAVFLFHGVTELEDCGIRNYTGKHIDRDTFASTIKLLSSSGHAVSIDELYAHVTKGQPCPKRSFHVTFDDGFWNNLSAAAPILKDFSVPATFYVTSDFVEYGSRSWTDRIEAAVASTPLRQISCPPPMEPNYKLSTKSDRILFLQQVRERVKASRQTDPDTFADLLVESLIGSDDLQFIETLDRKLNWHEVRQLDADPLFSVGGHGQTHRILGYLSHAEIQEEVTECISALRTKGGLAAEHFSYPEGFAGSYTCELVDFLGQLGVKTGVTTIPGANSAGQDPFQLRRIFVA